MQESDYNPTPGSPLPEAQSPRGFQEVGLVNGHWSGALTSHQGWMSFPGGSVVKNLPAMHETRVQFLGWEGPLEKGMATHSSILSWRIPWTEEPGGLQSMESRRVGHD